MKVIQSFNFFYFFLAILTLTLDYFQGPRASSTEENYYSGMKHQNLAQMLCEMRECNKTQQIEVEDLRQKHKDAQGDIKVI